MSIFVVFRVANPPKLEAELARVFPDDHFNLGNGQYLVSATGSAKNISDKIGVSDGETGPAMIFKMTNYFGRASTEIWDWVKSKAEEPSG